MPAHLTPEELIDLIEGRLAPRRAAHADECHRCRTETEALRDAVTQTRQVPPPAPSPLFWNHQARRIQAAVAGEAEGRETRWGWPRLGWRTVSAAAASFASLVLLIGLVSGDRFLEPDGPDTAIRGDAVPTPGLDGRGDEADWMLLLTVADGVDWPAPNGAPWPVETDTIDGAVAQLSAVELQALAELLEAELEGSSL